MILGLKSDGVYSKLLRFNPNAGGVEASAEIDQIIPSTNNINFVNSPTIDSTIGVTFNGTNQYATTGFVPNTGFASATNWQLYCYVFSGGTSASKAAIATYESSSKTIGLFTSVTSTSKPLCNGLAAARQANSSVVLSKGLGGSRTTSNRIDIFIDGVSQGNDTTVDGGNSPSIQFYYGARNNAGSPELYTNAKCAFMTLAEGMDAANMLSLHSRINTFLTAMGV